MKALLNSQEKAITHLQTKKVGALFKAPGTGKTRTAVELINQTDVDLVLWLAPLGSVKPQNESSGIKAEVSKWDDISKYHFYGIESIGMSDRIYLEVLTLIKDKKVFIVCDESILIKNKDSKRTSRLLKISKESECKLILNGTPFSKDLSDIYPQMEFLSPKILNMSYAQFENTFCEKTKVEKNGRILKEYISGYFNTDYLFHLIKPFIYEADLVLNIGVQNDVLLYSIDFEELERYNEIKGRMLEIETLTQYDNNIFLRMVQELQMSYCDSMRKIGLLEQVFKEHNMDSVAIYTKFVKSRELIKKLFPNAHVFSLQSESMSLNLQDQFNVTVEFDKTWDWKNVDQYKKRVFRTGQAKKVYHYYFTANNIGLDRLIQSNNDKKESALNYFKKLTKDESLRQIKECL